MPVTINRLPGYGDPIVLDVETLAGADLYQANLSGAKLSGADLSGADLYQANLSGAKLSGAALSRASLRGGDLTQAALTGATLTRANLTGANLYGANLSGADLTQADLRGAYLSGADLSEANLTQADLRGAYLSGADLRGAKIHDDTIDALLTRAGRSDGHECIAFRLADGSVKIMAGCRWMTPDEYKAHVADQYPDTDKARETLDIIEFIERRAAQ